jgi:hypothetical protein
MAASAAWLELPSMIHSVERSTRRPARSSPWRAWPACRPASSADRGGPREVLSLGEAPSLATGRAPSATSRRRPRRRSAFGAAFRQAWPALAAQVSGLSRPPLLLAAGQLQPVLGTLLIFFILKGDGDRVQNARLDMATKSLDLCNQLRQILARDIATVVAETDLAEGGS